MSMFKVLIVEDKQSDAQNLCGVLKRALPDQFTGGDPQQVKCWVVTNQEDADGAVAETGPAEPEGFDLVLLDLRYPQSVGGALSDDPDAEFQGMKWLPALRRLQPRATIIILTSYAYSHDLRHAVAAIRDCQAHDFVPKNIAGRDLVMRIAVACENARRVESLRRVQKEFRSLIHSRFARTYAEDVATLLDQTRTAFSQIARRLESGDPSALKAAPAEIRAGFAALKEEFVRLTTHLCQGEDRRSRVDLAEILRDLAILYEERFREAKGRIEAPPRETRVEVTTFPSDLKIALHEVIANAAETLEKSTLPPENRLCRLTVEASGEGAVIRVTDNGPGISNAAMERMFQLPERSDEVRPGRGIGLYVARRMMHSIGGSIQPRNRPEGGAEVLLTLRNLRPEGSGAGAPES